MLASSLTFWETSRQVLFLFAFARVSIIQVIFRLALIPAAANPAIK